MFSERFDFWPFCLVRWPYIGQSGFGGLVYAVAGVCGAGSA